MKRWKRRLLLLAPIVPHITEELWQMLGHKTSVANAAWPEFDPAIAREEEMTIVIQINGKLRSRMTVPVDEDAEKIKADALADEKIVALLKGHKNSESHLRSQKAGEYCRYSITWLNI